MSAVIKLENVSKQYRLGLIGTNTLKGDIQRWWYNLRGLPDPTLLIGQENILSASTSASTSTSTSAEYIWALKDINFDVQQGEVLGIIGKNGAGKSTLLKLLSRVTSPTTGLIKAKGRIASLLEVGTGFHPELTGKENIFLNGAILGMTKTEIRSRLDEIVEFAGVAKYIDTPVKRYSSGMYVRLAFAVAAHLDPEILIVDEVLAVGDAEFQKKALGKMQDVSSQGGRTILFVSHNMTAVKSLCLKGILLKNGQISIHAPIENVVNHYLSQTASKSQTVFDEQAENKYIKLFAVEILENKNGLFHIDKELLIRLRLRNKSIKEKLNINIYFKTIEGTIVFPSRSKMQRIPIGDFECICKVPANFLNDNKYILDIMVVKNGEKTIFFQQDALLIEGVEPIRTIAWMGKVSGFIRPDFIWQINPL